MLSINGPAGVSPETCRGVRIGPCSCVLIRLLTCARSVTVTRCAVGWLLAEHHLSRLRDRAGVFEAEVLVKRVENERRGGGVFEDFRFAVNGDRRRCAA